MPMHEEAITSCIFMINSEIQIISALITLDQYG